MGISPEITMKYFLTKRCKLGDSLTKISYMQKVLIKSLACLFLLSLPVSRSFAQDHYMHDRPGRPPAVVKRPPPPRPGAVWIDEDWKWGSGRYNWGGGYWATPPYPHARWIPGRWVRNRRFG